MSPFVCVRISAFFFLKSPASRGWLLSIRTTADQKHFSHQRDRWADAEDSRPQRRIHPVTNEARSHSGELMRLTPSLCVCVFCLYLHATLPRWNKDSMDSFLVSRLLNFFYVILNWGIQISCGYVCGFFFFFLHFHVVNIRWKLLSLAGSSKKKEKRDTPTLPSSTGAH